MVYNPFDKPLQELCGADLDILVRDSVTEGYWVEFKSEFQKSIKIAKSISSFANTYGGWYFIGIEADKITNAATKVNGITLLDVPDPIAKLRDSVKANVDPIPLFHPKLVEISPGRAVLVVQIPDNQDTPFITRGGSIYRRVSDSSNPVPENNRYAVDRLVDQGKELEKQLENFCMDERAHSVSENQQGWANIYLIPYPLGAVNKVELLSTTSVEELLKLSQKPLPIKLDPKIGEFASSNLPLNSGQLNVFSVILRQVEPSRAAFNSLTAELFVDGRAKFHIPLSYLPGLSQNWIYGLKSERVKQFLNDILVSDKDDSLQLLRFIDIRMLGLAVINFMNLYHAWFGNEVREFRLVIKLENVWRVVPFCDDDEWGDYIQKFGLPVQNVDFVRVPIMKGKGLHVTYPNWAMACAFMGMGFGLPPDLATVIVFKQDLQAKNG